MNDRWRPSQTRSGRSNRASGSRRPRGLWDTGQRCDKVEAEALVGASRDEVWQLYDDIEGTPRWVPFVSEILYVSGPARVGTVYRERTRLAGIPTIEQWEIVEHRRPTRQVHVSDAFGMESAADHPFEGRGTGTWVHQAAELRSRLWGPFGWVARGADVDPGRLGRPRRGRRRQARVRGRPAALRSRRFRG